MVYTENTRVCAPDKRERESERRKGLKNTLGRQCCYNSRDPRACALSSCPKERPSTERCVDMQ